MTTTKQIAALQSALLPGWEGEISADGRHMTLLHGDLQFNAWREGRTVAANWTKDTTQEEWDMLQRACQRVWHLGLNPVYRPSR